jgi:hypothetical protein
MPFPSCHCCIAIPVHAAILFEKLVLIRMFGRKNEDVTEQCGKLHGEEFHNLYFSRNIVRVIK